MGNEGESGEECDGGGRGGRCRGRECWEWTVEERSEKHGIEGKGWRIEKRCGGGGGRKGTRKGEKTTGLRREASGRAEGVRDPREDEEGGTGGLEEGRRAEREKWRKKVWKRGVGGAAVVGGGGEWEATVVASLAKRYSGGVVRRLYLGRELQGGT